MLFTLALSTLAFTANAADIGAQCTAVNYQDYPLFFKLANGAIDVLEPLANEFADELATLLGAGTHHIPVDEELGVDMLFNRYTLQDLTVTDLKVGQFNVDIGEITTPKPQGLAGSVNIKNIAFEFKSKATVKKCFKYVFKNWCSVSTTDYTVSSKFANASGKGSATLALATCPKLLSYCTIDAFKKNFKTVWDMKFYDLLTYVYPNGAKIDELSVVLPENLQLTFLTNEKNTFEAKIQQSLENIFSQASTHKLFRDVVQKLVTQFGPTAANVVINKVLRQKFYGDCDGSLLKYNRVNTDSKLCNIVNFDDRKITQKSCSN
ncbi:hypothetical protein BC833DRAFT_563888 [Globomyces pollinis-pini]|nr:hypothetical protein BC833DRAFT_563888 [Globomyces pollinis-pini]KAJ2995842.1 hypothetical protein HDV02_000359 [Globomyces sp. JEL0801]